MPPTDKVDALPDARTMLELLVGMKKIKRKIEAGTATNHESMFYQLTKEQVWEQAEQVLTVASAERAQEPITKAAGESADVPFGVPASGMESSLKAGRVKRADARDDGTEIADTEALHHAPASSALSQEPVKLTQTVMGAYGNCQSACLAMLLGLDLCDVPNFAQLAQDIGDNEAYAAQGKWLRERGWGLLTVVKWQSLPWPPRHGYFIAGGASPRGNRHAVIYKDGELWHDPHPDGGGISSVDDIDFLYPLNPANFAPNSATSPTNAVELLKRIRQWDMLDVTGDGPYWKGEIDKALGA